MMEDKYKKKEVKLPEKLIRNPYKYICNWVEDTLPHTGKKVFEILSLLPCSLILPDFIYKGRKIRSNINVLFLSPPGAGKSTIADMLSHITYSPISVRSVTPAKLNQKIHANPFFTFIVEDYATMSRDETVGKIIEGILGEEKRIQRSTMRGEIDTKTEGVGLICGTPDDLAEHLSGGMIFRLIPIILFHSIEEHSNIGQKIVEGIGEQAEFEETEEFIKQYYQELLTIQLDKHDSIEQIIEYNIPKEFGERIFQQWDFMTKEIYKRIEAPYNWFRSLHEFYRVLVAHAFLNVFNRKVENGVLYPNEEDFNVALKIMKKDLNTKYKVINTNVFLGKITSLKELYDKINSDTISGEEKNYLKALARIKKGKRN